MNSPVSHPNNFQDTISWECFVKNDGVRSCLTELQSFLHNKIGVDPIHRVLMFLPCLMHVLCKTWCFQIGRVKVLVFSVQKIHKQKEYRLSVLPLFIKPMTTKHKMILNIVLYPPEFNRAIVFSV